MFYLVVVRFFGEDIGFLADFKGFFHIFQIFLPLIINLMEESRPQYVFSVQECHRLLTLHRQSKSQETLKCIISQVSKLQPSQSCQPYMQDTMLQLLITFSNTRNDIVDQRLVCFLKEMQWFRKTFESEQLSLRKFIKSFEVVFAEKFTKIVRRGEQSDCFYILVKGKASVLKEKEGVIQALGKVETGMAITRRQCSFIEKEPNPMYWQELSELNQGQTFGEMGILYKRRRLLTIVTKTKCVLIKIPAETYIQISAEGTLKQHQKRLRFVCQRLSPKVRSLSYEQLQQTLFQFQPVSFPYGSVMFRSKSSDYFLIIEQGNAMVTYYQGKSIVRRQTLTQGRFIGLKQILRQLDPQRLLPRFQSPYPYPPSPHPSCNPHYQVLAASSQVHTYKVPKLFFLNMLRNHRQILNDIIQRKDYQLDLLERQVKTFAKEEMCKTEPDREGCKIAEEYQKMSSFIIRKRLEFKGREKEGFKA